MFWTQSSVCVLFGFQWFFDTPLPLLLPLDSQLKLIRKYRKAKIKFECFYNQLDLEIPGKSFKLDE